MHSFIDDNVDDSKIVVNFANIFSLSSKFTIRKWGQNMEWCKLHSFN